ncbi:MAG: AmmeMemoRadiSam system protein B [Desulfovibrio sp.]|nr:AmmeMemoRadiSam system protein B [Desulfovibrio sp.]
MEKQNIVREPVAIGRFYPQNSDMLVKTVSDCLGSPERNGTCEETRPWAVLLPHAGYMYCGGVLGKTLQGVRLPDTLLILCPNHTGRGKPLSVWPYGSWQTPMGNVRCESTLAARLVDEPSFSSDFLAHLGEHAIEVLLPFLAFTQEEGDLPSIIPVCVGVHGAPSLEQAGEELAHFIKGVEEDGQRLGVVVSSDMNHYESHEVCLKKDEKALRCIENADPEALLDVCMKEHISMCGAAPCALLLYAARSLGTLSSVCMAHTTSAEASGNFRQVVGYAGIRFFLSRRNEKA